ncbi:SDR family NAD(P)-dependent oxidoreductase [Tsuneonella flava]|uniref:SDR family NAD(P)-dependent oxidoreductase n=1 Tax=Tsuneonella flava TaxID=2055955 RepID=UPI001CC1F457|nr:SDR family NAD(P)-dependent oxidoreductase [Tsuneonella flava]
MANTANGMTSTDIADLFSLTDKVALVTGGARGLGKMIAAGLLRAGAKVYITSRKEEDALAAAADLNALGPCEALPGDAGSPDGITELAALFRQKGETALHILVNNAGRTWGAPFDSFPDKAWAGVMAVNVQAPFRLIQELLPELEAAASTGDPARVINIGSIAGSGVTDLQAYSYGASKAAIHFLGSQLAADLVSRNINVNTVAPGYFPTDMTAHLQDEDSGLTGKIPMRRMGNPADIAGAIIYLSSAAGAYLTGIVLPVDGGIAGTR